jgi:hypothetical protein
LRFVQATLALGLVALSILAVRDVVEESLDDDSDLGATVTVGLA